MSQRVARLGRATTAVLELAAVVGPEFDLAVLARGRGASRRACSDALDLAVRSGMIGRGTRRSRSCTASPTSSCAGRCTTACSAPRRAELHLRVGEALEAVAPQPAARALADLAHHFAVAAPLGGPDRAVAYNLRAAEAATAALAFDEARRRAAHGARARDPRPAQAGRGRARARHGLLPGRARLEAIEAYRGRGGDRPRLGRRRTTRPRGGRVRERLLAAGRGRRRARSSC